MNNPRLSYAQALIEYKGANANEQAQVTNKGIDLLADALEKHEVEPNNFNLLISAARANAMNNLRFVNAYRNALAVSKPEWKGRSDKEVKDAFEKLSKEQMMPPVQTAPGSGRSDTNK